MKLIGYIDGVEIRFDFYPPNTFKATIPKKLSGKYIVQLKVIDEAGNEENKADMYVYIDFQNMSFREVGSTYVNKIKDNNLSYIEIKNDYELNENNMYESIELNCKYTYKELIG